MSPNPNEPKLATIALPGTDGKQLAQGRLVESWTVSKDETEKTFAVVDVGAQNIRGELL